MKYKKRITIDLDGEVYLLLKNIAFWENRSLKNVIETALISYDYSYHRTREHWEGNQSK